jgi:hypothetical protein
MHRARSSRGWALPIATAVVTVMVLLSTGQTLAAFSSTTSNSGNSLAAAPDWVAPTLARTIAARSSGAGIPGQIRQGTGFYVYAQVTDTGNPASGVSTVTANVSSVAAGVTAASLATTGGPWTIGGLSYNRRSAVITASTPLSTGATYLYSITMTDAAGNSRAVTDNPVTIETYQSVLQATSGLLGHWRLGEQTAVNDTFTDTSGTLLQNHTGEVGATWTRLGSTPNVVVTTAGRIRRGGTGGITYSPSGTTTLPDYTVSANIRVGSSIISGSDAAGILARFSGTSGSENAYVARLTTSNGSTAATWRLERYDNGTATTTQTSNVTLATNTTYALALTVRGSSISLSVNGVPTLSTTDATYTSGGAAIRLGTSGSTSTPTDSSGLHMDNFAVTPLMALDSAGTNHGPYTGSTLGVAGALAGDTDTAASFNGSTDYVSIARGIQDNFSIEFWFRSTQGLNTNAQWWGNAGLVDAEVSGSAADFGVSLRSDGRVVAGVGPNPDTSIVSTGSGFNNGAWHHVVFTRTRASGALTLYVYGASQGTATGSTVALTAPPNITFARIQTGAFYYAGSLDEVAVYTAALSAATISDHYQSGRGA